TGVQTCALPIFINLIFITTVVDMVKKAFSKGRSLYRAALFPYTAASLKRKVIFVHIPKAAGTAVRVALGEPVMGRQHLPWWVYQQASPKRFQEYYKFAFVRDPLDRAFSGYNYLKSGGNKMGDLAVAEYLERYESFGEFIECELINGSMINHPIFRPQHWYLCDWSGEIRVDYVGRFESISSDIERIAESLSLKDFKGLPVVNKSKDSYESIGLEAAKLISEVYRKDYEIFEYRP